MPRQKLARFCGHDLGEIMWWKLFDPDTQRRWLYPRAAQGPYKEFLAQPFPLPKEDFRKADYAALDLETTGLDPQADQILSVGLVIVRNGNRIDLATAMHRLVRPKGGIPEESAVIHQITDDQAATGGRLHETMAELLQRLAGRVMLAHHARVEVQFLDRACRRLYGQRLVIPVVDTQVLAKRALDRTNQGYHGGELRLAALRSRYHLPRYPAHNALSDALAAAELFLALTARHAPGHKVPLRRVTVTI
jgi:DNA polymerase-3 subunit epsilon